MKPPSYDMLIIQDCYTGDELEQLNTKLNRDMMWRDDADCCLDSLSFSVTELHEVFTDTDT